MDSTTKDELKINTLRKDKGIMKDLQLEKLEDKVVEAMNFIQHACVEAIRALDDDEKASAAFEIGQIHGACAELANQIQDGAE